MGSVRVVENVPLASMTTLRLGGPARRLIAPDREEELVEAVAELDARNERLLVVGGGSNLVVSDDGFDGTVLRMMTRGFEIASAGGQEGRVLVTAAAGEPWDDLVTRCVAEGLSGVECLGGIPGLVGAVPMQNVGAYGQDVSETIVQVRTWDRAARSLSLFDREACQFAYRSSAFRGRDGHVILGVTFALAKSELGVPVRYAELARALGVKEGERAPLGRIRETVIALRRTKGMVVDDADLDTRSAGSFFTNPILDANALERLRERVKPALRPGESMPVFPEADGRAKVSAAWLIERAGFGKGHAAGPVAISSKHALALTNRGRATTGDLLALARAIRAGVLATHGVVLENEPVFVGVTL
jgi:UDP-N-acetylmuramate dehydrogenase